MSMSVSMTVCMGVSMTVSMGVSMIVSMSVGGGHFSISRFSA